SGVVKRIIPSALPVRPDAEVIGLKPRDVVVGGSSAPDDTDLVFVTSDAQLLHYSASQVRPQGGPAGGMAGVKVGAGAEVIAFAVISAPETAIVVTISGADGTIAGT